MSEEERIHCHLHVRNSHRGHINVRVLTSYEMCSQPNNSDQLPPLLRVDFSSVNAWEAVYYTELSPLQMASVTSGLSGGNGL
jgi:hypothetical protein